MQQPHRGLDANSFALALQCLVARGAPAVHGGAAQCYRAFDIYVSAARFEPFGLTILEAMDAGCPMIVTRTEGPTEFLKDERVLWAETNDVATLAQQLSAAANRKRERLAYDLAPFLRENATKAIKDFYRVVLSDVARKRSAKVEKQ